MDQIENITQIQKDIRAAEKEAGRPQNATKLIAVTKKFPAERILPVLRSGHVDFGENRVQEAQGKWPILREQFGDICLHLIGPLQTNKTKLALDLFDVIHTLDREKLAKSLAKEIQKTGTSPKLLIQINTGEEPQKAGVLPGQADDFIEKCRTIYDLDICGLMCIPPIDEAPSLHFSLLEKIAMRHALKELSMGMSADFKTAVTFGATYVRVGEGIFGKREL